MAICDDEEKDIDDVDDVVGEKPELLWDLTIMF